MACSPFSFLEAGDWVPGSVTWRKAVAQGRPPVREPEFLGPNGLDFPMREGQTRVFWLPVKQPDQHANTEPQRSKYRSPCCNGMCQRRNWCRGRSVRVRRRCRGGESLGWGWRPPLPPLPSLQAPVSRVGTAVQAVILQHSSVRFPSPSPAVSEGRPRLCSAGSWDQAGVAHAR